MGDLFCNRYAQGGITMIWCVEDDASIRDIELYALAKVLEVSITDLIEE